jgi:hypothetical protein
MPTLVTQFYYLYTSPVTTGSDWKIIAVAPSGGSAEISFDGGSSWISSSTYNSTYGGFEFTPSCWGTFGCVPPFTTGSGVLYGKKTEDTGYLKATIGAGAQNPGGDGYFYVYSAVCLGGNVSINFVVLYGTSGANNYQISSTETARLRLAVNGVPVTVLTQLVDSCPIGTCHYSQVFNTYTTTAGSFPFSLELSDITSTVASWTSSIAVTNIGNPCVAALNITATAVNDTPPVGVIGVSQTFNVSTNDTPCSAGTTTYVLQGSPTGATVSIAASTGIATFTPTSTSYNFQYAINCNGIKTSENATVSSTATGSCTAPTINVNSVPSTAITGSAFSGGITFNGTTPLTLGTVTGLPVGVSASISGNTVTLSGTPSVAGVSNYSIQITNACGSVTASGTITISASCVNVTQNTNTLASSAVVGTAISGSVTLNGTAPFVLGVIGGLPAGTGVTLIGNTITITGAPTTAGTYNISIAVSNCSVGNVIIPKTIIVTNTPGVVVVSGTVNPVTSSTLTLDFGNLPVGNYVLELDSTSCLGQATNSFSITAPLVCPECFENVLGNCVPIVGCGEPVPNQGILVEDFTIDSIVGKTIALSLSGGVIGETIEVELKQGNTVVGTSTGVYASTVTLESAQYGYVDVFINNGFKSTIYLPYKLLGNYVVEESKGVDDNDAFMKLVYTQDNLGEFTVSDIGSMSYGTVYYNVNGKWRNTLSGLKLEPYTNHSITKFAYNGGYWGDNSAAQEKKQISFRIKEGTNEEGKSLIFVVNLTGNAFDFNSPGNNYISNGQIQLVTDALTGANSEVVDAIRMPFIWGDYNPSSGVYKDAEMTAAINWVKSLRPSLPVKIDLLIVPILGGNDSRIPLNEVQVDNNGNLQDCTYNSLFTTVPSYFSNTAKTHINTMLNHLIPRLASVHGNDIRMIEYGAGQSEEHYMPYTSQYAGGSCGAVFSGIGDYSTGASLPAWRQFLANKYGSGTNLPYLINGVQYNNFTAQIPNVGVTAGNNYNMNYTQEAYRDLFRFYSQGIFDTWKNFHDRVKALSTFKTGFVIADFLNEQGQRWIFHGGAIFLAMKYADQFYHTYNIDPGEWYANLWGTDVLLGTFPNSGKHAAIEYDNFDAGATGGGSLNTAHVKDSMLRFIKNGGKVVHTALGWTTPQMVQWKALIKDVKDNYINNSAWTLEDRTSAPVITIDTAQVFNNPYIYRDAWTSAGGNHVQSNPQAYSASPLNLQILNNGTVDNFWI